MNFAITFLFLSLFGVLLSFSIVNADPLVPALIIFGDSNVDSGNNNKLYTSVKANFLPYGRDFVSHQPTGRFTNGMVVTDFIAEAFGFSSFQPAYLSANENDLLIGANFGSAASGYLDWRSQLLGTLSLTQQLQYYKEYQTILVNLVGEAKSSDILSNAIFILTTGSSDFLSYVLNPILGGTTPPDQFSNMLLASYSNFIQNLYTLGAKKIGVTNIAPVGCVPLVITARGLAGSNQCIDSVNQLVFSFNQELQKTSESLRNKLPGLRLTVLDLYEPFMDLIKRPAFHGFSETRRGCCGTGLLEFAILCNAMSVGTCANATEYIFWDSIHSTEAANKIMAGALLEQGKTLIPPP